MSRQQSSGAAHEAPLASMNERQRATFPRLLIFSLVMFVGVSLTLILPVQPQVTSLAVGTVSPQTVLARKRVVYKSAILTEAERARAEAAVQPVYTVEGDIARQQVTRARQVLSYISSIRQDGEASHEDKMRWLGRISDLSLSTAALEQTLALDEASWNAVTAEVVYLLDRLMRAGVREDQLAAVNTSVPGMVSYTLTAPQADIVAAFVRSLLKPNGFYDPESTESLRQQARTSVAPVQHVIEVGQAVVRQGDIVVPFHMEQLVALGLEPTASPWQALRSRLALVLVLIILLAVYSGQFCRDILSRQKRLALLALLMILPLVAAKWFVPGHVLLPYLFPIAAAAMLISVLLDARLAMVAAIVLSVLIGYLTGGSADLMIYFLLGGMFGAIAVSRSERLSTFAWAALGLALVNGVVSVSLRLFGQPYDSTAMLQVLGASAANGLLSASLTFTAFFWLGGLFGITTPLQLLELARPTHPLARRLLLEAPGTYHHSLIVGNLGERAAELVGADPLLVRVAALHHDIGKVLRPYFFVENQVAGENYHQQLDARTSAQIIIAHVKDSIDLGRKYHFPDGVIDLIAQHHGTTSVGFGYFYQRATQETETEVDEADFRYPGPKPRSKEAAILMLADSVEAAVRASAPGSAGEIERIVRKITNDRLVSGELDECDVTLRDLDDIRTAFIEVLQGVFHSRLQYPERDSLSQAEVGEQT